MAEKAGQERSSTDLPHRTSDLRLGVLLYQPEIPQNTGNIARSCAATDTPLYLVGPLGFKITDRHLKRAGLDYWPHVRLSLFDEFSAAVREIPHRRLVYFSAHAPASYFEFTFRGGDCLVFGRETRGLPREILESYPGAVLNIPIDRAKVRSLNLSTSVGVALFEALRQLRA